MLMNAHSERPHCLRRELQALWSCRDNSSVWSLLLDHRGASPGEFTMEGRAEHVLHRGSQVQGGGRNYLTNLSSRRVIPSPWRSVSEQADGGQTRTHMGLPCHEEHRRGRSMPSGRTATGPSKNQDRALPPASLYTRVREDACIQRVKTLEHLWCQPPQLTPEKSHRTLEMLHTLGCHWCQCMFPSTQAPQQERVDVTPAGKGRRLQPTCSVVQTTMSHRSR